MGLCGVTRATPTSRASNEDVLAKGEYHVSTLLSMLQLTCQEGAQRKLYLAPRFAPQGQRFKPKSLCGARCVAEASCSAKAVSAGVHRVVGSDTTTYMLHQARSGSYNMLKCMTHGQPFALVSVLRANLARQHHGLHLARSSLKPPQLPASSLQSLTLFK